MPLFNLAHAGDHPLRNCHGLGGVHPWSRGGRLSGAASSHAAFVGGEVAGWVVLRPRLKLLLKLVAESVAESCGCCPG